MTNEDGAVAAATAPRETRPGKEVFLSWSGSAKPLARALASFLKVAGASPFLSLVSIKLGKPWEEELEDALTRCDSALILVTPDSIRSHWVMWEAGAIHNQPRRPRVFPILVGTDEGPDPLTRLQAATLLNEHAPDERKRRMRDLLGELCRSVDSPTKGEAFDELFDVYWDSSLSEALDRTMTLAAQKAQTSVRLRSALTDAQRNVQQLGEQMRILTVTQDDPCYFMDASFRITLANLAAFLVFDLDVEDRAPHPIDEFIESIRERLVNFDEMLANFERRFRTPGRRPPRVDAEPAVFRHHEFGEIHMKKVGIAVPDLTSRDGEPDGWVVSWNLLSVERRDRFDTTLARLVKAHMRSFWRNGDREGNGHATLDD